MKTQKTFRKKSSKKKSSKKKGSRKKRTSKRIMIGGQGLSRHDVAYLQSMVFQVELAPDDPFEEEGYDDDNDYDEDEDEDDDYDGTETWDEYTYRLITDQDIDRDMVNSLIDNGGFRGLNYLRNKYPDGYIPYFNVRGKSTQALYTALNNYLHNHGH